MENKVSTVLIGINGYGRAYIRKLLTENDNAFINGVVEIFPEKSEYYSILLEQNIPICKTMKEFYQHYEADLAIISTPIHLHAQQAIYAMEHGSNVLCEKPATGNPEDLKRMIDVRNKTGKFLAVGFNWSFTAPVQALKQDIINGKFGKAKRFKSVVLWPRGEDYYSRTSWAGKKYNPDGEMIFDSVANNATAHFLHHLFYLLGSETEESAQLSDVTAELYRVNDIETFDTCAVRARTSEDVEILYFATHAVREKKAPCFQLEFEKAVLTYHPESDAGEAVTVQFHDGTTEKYPELDAGSLAKVDVCIDAVKNNNRDILCGIDAASTHVHAIHAMHQSVPDPASFPEELIHYDKKEKIYWVDGLEKTLLECYENGVLPSDAGVKWSKLGRKINC